VSQPGSQLASFESVLKRASEGGACEEVDPETGAGVMYVDPSLANEGANAIVAAALVEAKRISGGGAPPS
jgi:hypothetical protein